MKIFRLTMLCFALVFCAASAFGQSVPFGQSPRLDDLSSRLAQQADDLADKSYRDYGSNQRNGRAEADALYLSEQFRASANLLRRMIQDRRRTSELRDAAAIITDLARRANNYGPYRTEWSDAQRTLEDISRELNRGGGYGGGGDDGGRTSGRLRWRGTVDDEVNLVIRDTSVEVRTLGGNEYRNFSFNFTSSLPRRRVTVNVTKLSGRGDVRVIQQPSRDNDFTAIIEITDKERGPRDYEIEVSW